MGCSASRAATGRAELDIVRVQDSVAVAKKRLQPGHLQALNNKGMDGEHALIVARCLEHMHNATCDAVFAATHLTLVCRVDAGNEEDVCSDSETHQASPHRLVTFATSDDTATAVSKIRAQNVQDSVIVTKERMRAAGIAAGSEDEESPDSYISSGPNSNMHNSTCQDCSIASNVEHEVRTVLARHVQLPCIRSCKCNGTMHAECVLLTTVLQ